MRSYKDILKNLSPQIIDRILIIAIAIYPLMWIWQGGSLTDSGYFAYNYQNFFSNLSLGETESISFLADFIGALWLYFFSSFGILGLNFLYLIFFYLIMRYTYLFLRLQLPRSNLMMLGLWCGVVFSLRYIDFMFSRDVLSYVFLISMAFFLFKGLLKGISWNVGLAGSLFTLACLSRLPNIIFLGILPILIWYWFLWKGETIVRQILLRTAKYCAMFLLGSAFCLALFLATLWSFNIFGVFMDNLGFLREFTAGSNSSSYSSSFLLKIYYLETVQKFIPHLIILFAVCISSIVLFSYTKKKRSKILFWAWALALAFISFRTYSSFDIRSHIRYFAPAICLYPLIFSLFKRDKFAILFLFGASLTFTQVIGSNTGLYLKMIYGMILLLPVAFLSIAYYHSIKFESIKFSLKPIIFLAALTIIVFGFYSRWGWIYHVGSGYKLRLRAVYTIDHPKMEGILTTQALAIHIENLSKSIVVHNERKNPLFIFGHQPMFYYLTDTKSPIKDIWLINSMITVDRLFSELSLSIEETKKYPLIVDTKNSKMGEEGDLKLKDFLERYNYLKVDEASGYAIWKRQ